MSAESNLKGRVTVSELAREARAVVRRSAESRATVPHLELEVEVELAEDFPGGTAMLAAACARALRAYPRANGAYRDGSWESYSRVNLGLLVATGDTYAIPVLRDADARGVAELEEEIATLRARALAGQLQAPDLAGATFTLWDAGEVGVHRAALPPVPPQAGILVAGSLRQVPIVRQGAIVPAHGMTLVLSCDHRILYGSAAAEFLLRIKTELQEATR